MPIISEKDRRALSGVDRDGRVKRRMSAKERNRRLLILLIFTLLVLVGVIATHVFILPMIKEHAELAEDMQLEIRAGKRNSLELSWTPAKRTSGYRVEIYDLSGARSETTPVFERFTRRAKCTLQPGDIPKTQPVRITITARDILYFLDKQEEHEPETASYECYLNEPEIVDDHSRINNEAQKIELSWKGWEGDTYTIYLVQGGGNDRTMIKEIQPEAASDTASPGDRKDFEVDVDYGPHGDFRLPKDDKSYKIEIEATREQDGVVFQGKRVELMEADRRSLMSKTIVLASDKLQDNHYRIYWNDTGSLGYQVQMKAPGAPDFVTLTTVRGDTELSYDTENLLPGRTYTFRVRAVNEEELFDEPIKEAFETPFEQLQPGSTQESGGICEIETAVCNLYATIWPTKELAIYSDSSKSEQTGTVPASTALCILGEDKENHLFRIRLGDAQGYIDSNYCMINLPEYIGDLCLYDIPNSYAAIYMVNGYYIPNVTGRVTPGYENILLDDNTFVVPLLYPVAEKLVDAAENTLAHGFRIKINDSFRPHCATRSIYDETEKVLYVRHPDIRYAPTSFERYIQNGRHVEDPAPSALPASMAQTIAEIAGQDTTGVQGLVSEGDGPVQTQPVEAPSENASYSYYWEMTNGTWRLGSFLAAAASRHNLGVAMDMTMVSLDTGRDITAQSDMHNLSWYSAQSRNTKEADLLKEYVTAAGFGMISSEWWHFQDNEATDSLKPPIVENGISVEGWKRDDQGWRYRDAKGNYIVNQDREINGVTYTFTPEGYTQY